MARDTEEIEEAITATTEEGEGEAAPKKSALRKLFRFLFWSGFLVAALLAAAAAVVQYYLPADTLRPIIEREAGKALNMPVSIGSLRFSLFSGLEIGEVQLGDGEKPLAKIHSAVLDYDLTQLLRGRLLINKIIVDRPSFHLASRAGVWNFQALAGEPGPKTEKVPSEKTAPAAIPVAVNLNLLAINRLQADVAMDDRVQARVEGLSIEARGRIESDATEADLVLRLEAPESGKHNIEYRQKNEKPVEFRSLLTAELKLHAPNLESGSLAGRLEMKNTELALEKPVPAVPPLALEVDAEGSAAAVTVRKLDLGFGKTLRLQVAGEGKSLRMRPAFKLNLQNADFDLDDLMRLAGKLAAPASAHGKLHIRNLSAEGTLPGFRPDTVTISGGEIATENLGVAWPPAAAELRGLSSQIKIRALELYGGAQSPRRVDLDLRLGAEHAAFRDTVLRKLNQQLSLKLEAGEGESNLPESVRATFSTSADALNMKHPKLGQLSTSISAAGEVSGNPRAGQISIPRLQARAGDFLNLTLRGEAEEFGRKKFSAEPNVKIDLGRILPLLPADIRAKLGDLRPTGTAQVAAHLQGQLDETYKPVAADGTAEIHYATPSLNIAKPPAAVRDLALGLDAGFHFDAGKGLHLPSSRLTVRLARLDALDNWHAENLDLDARLMTEHFLPLAGLPESLPVSSNTRLKAGFIAGKAQSLHLAGLDLDAKLRADVLPASADARNLSLDARVALGEGELAPAVKTGNVSANLSLSANDRTLSRARIDLKSRVESPRVAMGNGADIRLDAVRLDAQARGDVKSGNLDLDKAVLEVPNLLQFDARGWVRKHGETFKLAARLPELRLGALWELLPRATRKKFPHFKPPSGTASLDFAAEGKKPGEKELQSLDIPVDARIQFALKQGEFASTEAPAFKAQGVNFNSDLALKDNRVTLKGNLSAEKLFPGEKSRDALNPEFEFSYDLDGWNKFNVRKHRLSIPGRGFQHIVRGKIEGLKAFAQRKAEPVPAELLRRVSGKLSSEIALKMDQALPIVNDLKLNGGLNSQVSLSLAAGKELVLDGDLRFANFSAALQPKLKILGIDGVFLFGKTMKVGNGPSEREDKGLAEKGFFTQLRDFSRYKNILRVGVVEYENIRLSRIGLDVLFKDDRLEVEKFIMDALKGSVSGQLFVVQTPSGPRLAFATEFAAIDFNELLPARKTVGGRASQADGNVQFGLQIRQGAGHEKVALDQLSLKLAITRIGEETLNRILLFIDPDESKPAIVDTRAKLKMASPHQLEVSLENGNISVETWLKTEALGIIKAPELKRVPLSGLRQFADVSERLQMLAGLRGLLDFLAARQIALKEDNSLVLY